MTVCSQLSLSDVYKNCQDLMITDKPAFFSLLEEHLDISEFIPFHFYNAFKRLQNAVIRINTGY